MAFENIVLYHYPCPDGITAALAAYVYHKRHSLPVRFLPNRTFKPIDVGDLNLTGTETVYLLDFAGPPGFASQVASKSKECIVLDHHKTAQEDLTGPNSSNLPKNLIVHFDMERSGATIALDYFKPHDQSLDKDSLDFFKYVEDADLWRWKLPDSKAFHCGFSSADLEFDVQKNPTIFEQLLTLTPQAMIENGKPILEYRQKRVIAALESAHTIFLGGKEREDDWGKALAIIIPEEDPELALFRSELGNQLAEKSMNQGHRAIGAIVYKQGGMSNSDAVKVSLRSIGLDEDTTVISRAYGGGGHRNASSFLIDENEFLRTWSA